MRTLQVQQRFSSRFLAMLSLAVLIVTVPFFLTGCGNNTKESPSTAQAPSDADLIKAQRECPLTGKKLGSMGKPVKVMVKSEPVFLCCDSCKDEALAKADKTLAKVKELKTQQNKPQE